MPTTTRQTAKHPFTKKMQNSQSSVIGVLQLKGGVGRSTVATNLAGQLSKLGRTVLIDCDLPQGTASSWYALRQQAGRAGNLLCAAAASHRQLVALVEQQQDAAYIVLDGPPRLSETSRATLLLASIVIVPMAASAAEVWATGDTVVLIREAAKVKPITTRLLWTRHRAVSRLAMDLAKDASRELGLVELATTLGLRVAYVGALGCGLTATELQDSLAKREVANLTNEILDLLSKSK